MSLRCIVPTPTLVTVIITSALLRASGAVWNARARVLIVGVVENFVVAYLELHRQCADNNRQIDTCILYRKSAPLDD